MLYIITFKRFIYVHILHNELTANKSFVIQHTPAKEPFRYSGITRFWLMWGQRTYPVWNRSLCKQVGQKNSSWTKEVRRTRYSRLNWVFQILFTWPSEFWPCDLENKHKYVVNVSAMDIEYSCNSNLVYGSMLLITLSY